LRLRPDRHIRRRILRLLEAEFCRNVGLMAAEDQHDMPWARQAMRLTVRASPLRRTCEYAGPLSGERFVAVLEIPPVESAETAVRAQIVKDVKTEYCK
jgi:hypothetical protein